MNWKAARTSALLTLLFLVVYNTCNWLTSLRHDVGSFYFQWERHIPFVPIFIIPYMSIDLFFVPAPFICTTDRELRTFRNRVTAAILIAAVFFLLMPFRFAFERPYVSGPLGLIFNNFRNIDKPFNEFPSLHMALRTILALLYVRHTRGILRWLIRIWFSLIGFSTLLTYQHHIMDVLGGFALAAICIYAFGDQPLSLPVVCNRRAGGYYLAGSILAATLAILTRPLGLLLLWPAISLAIVATAYFGLGPGIFRKTAGKLPFTTRLLLWPVLLGQRLSLWHYARQCDPWNALTPELWIGRKLSDAEAHRAISQGVRAVLDLTGEFSEARPFRILAYRQLPIMDLTAPPPAVLDEAIEFIRANSAKGPVYVHCKAGYSRTAAIAGSYLISNGHAATVEQAIALLRAARPAIVIRPEVREALESYFHRRA